MPTGDLPELHQTNARLPDAWESLDLREACDRFHELPSIKL